ncbi:hypothetical protein tb265_48450 [Gemmatimonadetes bacterium T265]|nr:hypothetical protein tb265_45420 [Gemmatimonadetes bacterium T265]GJG89664.1 hypothetical protein tb265_48450 [Gemmatimonadetes bacterium T265]
MPHVSDVPNDPGEAPAGTPVETLVERLVRDARLPSAPARADLRRELTAHFEDALASAEARGIAPAEALEAALARFGDVPAVAAGLRRAHRPGRAALYAAKVLASGAASLAAAVALQALAHPGLAFGPDGPRLPPWHAPAVRAAVGLVLVAVAAWELDVAPLCVRLDRRPARLLATFAALLAAVTVTHTALHDVLAPAQVLLRTAATVAAWVAAVAIVARVDLAFVRRFGSAV